MTAFDRTGYTSRSESKRHKRSSPVAQATGGTSRISARPNINSSKPRTFAEWWSWALDQSDFDGRKPLRLHDHHRPPEPQSADTKDEGGRRLSKRRDQIIMGQPFSVPFERYLAGHLPDSALRYAMGIMRNRRHSPQSQEFRILCALASGHDDPEIVRVVVLGGCHVAFFEAATIRALEFVWERAQDTLLAVVDPPAPAGAA